MKHIGGRGHKSPYGITKAIRVPIDLIPLVERLSDDYKQSLTIPNIGSEQQSQLSSQIKMIQNKIMNNSIGYKEKSAARLIKEILSLKLD